MNSPGAFLAELSPLLVRVLPVLIIAGIFLGTGIYVVSGRWASTLPKRDADAIARWEDFQRSGFFVSAMRRSMPFYFAFFFASTFLKAWRLSGSLALTPEEVINTGLLASAVGLAGSRATWHFVRRRAEEAHDRAARAQDERTA